jgi:hypothetical protein
MVNRSYSVTVAVAPSTTRRVSRGVTANDRRSGILPDGSSWVQGAMNRATPPSQSRTLIIMSSMAV